MNLFENPICCWKFHFILTIQYNCVVWTWFLSQNYVLLQIFLSTLKYFEHRDIIGYSFIDCRTITVWHLYHYSFFLDSVSSTVILLVNIFELFYVKMTTRYVVLPYLKLEKPNVTVYLVQYFARKSDHILCTWTYSLYVLPSFALQWIMKTKHVSIFAKSTVELLLFNVS